jgi:hypothetical protein
MNLADIGAAAFSQIAAGARRHDRQHPSARTVLMKHRVTTASLTALLLLALSGAARAETARELSWAALVPPVTQAPNGVKSKGFLANAQPRGSDGVPLPAVPEAGWMSSRMQQPDSHAPPAVATELDGQRVRIGGYAVTLDFDATKIREFLLVPFVGACIHVPPPPPNQIIYVKAARGVEVSGQFAPVSVTGTLKTTRQFTGLAVTGYTMEAEEVELRRE